MNEVDFNNKQKKFLVDVESLMGKIKKIDENADLILFSFGFSVVLFMAYCTVAVLSILNYIANGSNFVVFMACGIFCLFYGVVFRFIGNKRKQLGKVESALRCEIKDLVFNGFKNIYGNNSVTEKTENIFIAFRELLAEVKNYSSIISLREKLNLFYIELKDQSEKS